MFIITADEDIIDQLALNKSSNTKIIDLDNHSEQISLESNSNGDTLILPFLPELSKFHSNNNEVYQRALHSSTTLSSKAVKIRKRSLDRICAICGDKAIACYYNALSCNSCKAFFRRNANKNLENVKCLTGEEQCSVAHQTHRKCPKCRLERCLAVGMRKEFISRGETKAAQEILPKQNENLLWDDQSTSVMMEEESTLASDDVDRLLNDVHFNLFDGTLFDTLSVEDWLIIENVRSTLSSIFENNTMMKYPASHCTDPTSALISLSSSSNDNVLNVIKFFRRINEFEQLDANDRFLLIKYNLLPLYPILKCFHFRRTLRSPTSESFDEEVKSRDFYALCFGSEHAHQTYENVALLLMQTIEQDETILSLLLIVLMFSQGLSMNEDEPPLKDALQVNRAQSHYLQLLWYYSVQKWGDIEAHKRFTLLLPIIFQMQKTSKMLCDYFYALMTTSDAVDQITPLMQTVLHIS